MKEIYVKTAKMLQSLDLPSLIGVKYIPFLLKYRNIFYGQGIKFNKDYYHDNGLVFFKNHYYLYIEIDKNNYDYLEGVIAIIYAYYDLYYQDNKIDKLKELNLGYKLMNKDNIKLLYYRNLLIGDILSGYYLKYYTYKCYLQEEFKSFNNEVAEVEKYYGYKYYLRMKIIESLNKVKYHAEMKQMINQAYDVKTAVYYLQNIKYMYAMIKKVEELGNKTYQECVDYSKQLINVDNLIKKEMFNKLTKHNYNLLCSEERCYEGLIDDYEQLIDINNDWFYFSNAITIKTGLTRNFKSGDYLVKLNGLSIVEIKELKSLKSIL